MQSVVEVSRALLSVSDKSAIMDFASQLAAMDVELISTGGTARVLENGGLSVREVADVTAFPEIMDGRLKTLHPRIHGGLLHVRGDAAHEAMCEAHSIPSIDLVAVNLYPFETMVDHGADHDTLVENIDIGGPAMIRSAAKNHAYVTVIVDPDDYEPVLAELKEYGGVTSVTRRRLAGKAFARVAAYDAIIADWFGKYAGVTAPSVWSSFAGHLVQPLRYGENPHQAAALYRGMEKRPGVVRSVLAQGKPLSYNNISDADAAFELVAEFDPAGDAAVVIVKHANPCGVALAATAAEAYRQALACDRVSAFGGIIACNRPVDADLAGLVTDLFAEVVIAPDADDEARMILAEKKNLRLLLTGSVPDPREPMRMVKMISGGFLVQDRDNRVVEDLDLKTVTRSPTAREWADLCFAFRVVKHVKSNAIVLARDCASIGIGAGQMSRLDAVRIAIRKASDMLPSGGDEAFSLNGAVMASDAFFPFVDGLQAAIDAGVTAVIQPGGSIRDDEIIAAANAAGIALVLTGVRHFRH